MTPEYIEKLLAPFADPATEMSVRDLGSNLVFRLIRRGRPLSGTIDKTSSAVTVDAADTIGLKQFLASARLGNLVALAQTQARVFDSSQLIPRSVVLDGTVVPDGLEALAGIRPKPGSTHVVIVSAPAGMGKTKLAEALVKRRADEFVGRKGDRGLALLVSSRGRRLSLLNDVIAGTLGDLRAPITQHEVPPLVSMGLVDLIIDGFDELVNADGYRDAWESVGRILEQIGVGGLVVLSARDAFFTEQEFVARAKREEKGLSASLNFSLLELLPLNEQDIRTLITSRNVPVSLVDPLMELCEGLPRGLRGRPFFIERLAHRVTVASAIEFESPLTVAIDDFIQREAPLLFGENFTDKDEATLCEFFEEVAIEMRRQEVDSLDVDTVRFFLDVVLENAQILPDRRKALVHRAQAVAFMEINGGTRRRGFPHEVVRDHFVSRRILSAIREARSTSLKEVIGVGTFSLDLADALRTLLDHRGIEVPAEWCQRALSIAEEVGSTDVLGQNALLLAFALALRLRQEDPLAFVDIAVGNVSFVDARLEKVAFRKCVWASLDLSGCDARTATFNDCDVHHLRITEETVLSRSFVDGTLVRCVEVPTDRATMREIREPSEIGDALRTQLVEEDPQPKTPGEALLLRVAIRWRRTGYLDTDDTQQTPAFADPLWPQLRALLENHGRLQMKVIPMQGPRKPLGALRDAAGLARRWHHDPAQRREIEAIWSEAARLTVERQ